MNENIPIRMIRENLDHIPSYDLPPPYTIRPYQPGDEVAWINIHREADDYNTITPALFEQEFGVDVKVLTERQYYLCDETGTAIGTATAWFNTYQGQDYGRVHWVAIVPSRQGRGLARPLMTIICDRLRDLGHKQAYLSTSTARIPAICLYLKFGFVPDIKNETDIEAWRKVRGIIQARFKGALR